jgi:hypothetical protein
MPEQQFKKTQILILVPYWTEYIQTAQQYKEDYSVAAFDAAPALEKKTMLIRAWLRLRGRGRADYLCWKYSLYGDTVPLMALYSADLWEDYLCW